MTKRIRVTAVGTLGILVLASGCATKGQLRRSLAEQAAAHDAALQSQRQALESQLEAERNERVAADQQMAADVGALNSDLAGLRSDFGVRLAQLEEGLEFAVPVHFAFDAAEVKDDARPVLDRFAALVQRHYPGAMITVEGFADPAGPAAYNKRLSAQRAESVRTYLVSQGLADSQLRAVGYGEDRQVVPGAAGSAFGAEMNRRVVFVVETPRVAGVAVTSEDPTR